jgi:hypothetical protein
MSPLYNPSSGGGAVSSVVGQTGAVTGTQIAADSTIAAAFAAKSARVPAATEYFIIPDSGSPSTSTPTLNLLMLFPFVAWESMNVDRIGFEVSTASAAGGVARAGIYARDSATGAAGALVVDGGSVAVDVTGVKNVTISSTPLAAGLYWVGLVAQTQQPVLRVHQAAIYAVPMPYGTSAPSSADLAGFRSGITYSGVTGALPATLVSTSWGLTDRAPKMFLRAA